MGPSIFLAFWVKFLMVFEQFQTKAVAHLDGVPQANNAFSCSLPQLGRLKRNQNAGGWAPNWWKCWILKGTWTVL